MFEISLFNLTMGAKAKFPMLMIDGEMTREQSQSSQINPILGSYPNVQITALGVATFEMSLDLWGDHGLDFYNEMILPAYGLATGQPQLLQFAWGSTADKAFTGSPIGMPPTKVKIGKKTGEIHANVFDFTLTQIANTKPKLVSVQTGEFVSGSQMTYTTAAGDDLGLIAQRFNTSVSAIAQANGGNPSYIPAPGTRLLVPKN
jgi:LysM repeat protein